MMPKIVEIEEATNGYTVSYHWVLNDMTFIYLDDEVPSIVKDVERFLIKSLMPNEDDEDE